MKPLYTAALSWYPYSKNFAASLVKLSRFGDPYDLGVHDAARNLLGVPRAIFPLSPDDRRVDGMPIRVKSSVIPRSPEQAEVIEKAAALLKGGESFILEAATGFGKTVMTSDLIARVGRKTLVVVPKSDLIETWRTALKEFLNLPDARIGYIRQDTYKVAGCDVVIGMLQSLVLEDRYPVGLAQEFGLVVFDEVHRLGAETFSRAAAMFSAKLRLGLSATPQRADGKEEIFLAHIGPVRIRSALVPMTPKVLIYRSGWKVPLVKRRTPLGTRTVKLPHSPGKDGAAVTSLVEDMGRNTLLATLIYRCWSKKRRTVVFSHRLEHLDVLAARVSAAGVPGSEYGFYVGGKTAAELDAISGKRIIFATYGMMKEGTNIPWLDCCILATPMSNVKQAIGRILREYEGKAQPVIFDIRDSDSRVFKAYGERRLEIYQAMKADIVLMGDSP